MRASIPRVPPPRDGDERQLLLRWLRFHRGVLVDTCAGLSDGQLGRSVRGNLMQLVQEYAVHTSQAVLAGRVLAGASGP